MKRAVKVKDTNELAAALLAADVYEIQLAAGTYDIASTTKARGNIVIDRVFAKAGN